MLICDLCNKVTWNSCYSKGEETVCDDCKMTEGGENYIYCHELKYYEGLPTGL